jgi:hypothetical protein
VVSSAQISPPELWAYLFVCLLLVCTRLVYLACPVQLVLFLILLLQHFKTLKIQVQYSKFQGNSFFSHIVLSGKVWFSSGMLVMVQ